MKTDFQPNEVLMAESLNANFLECAGKEDKVPHIEVLEKGQDNKYELDGTKNGHSYLLNNPPEGTFSNQLFKSSSQKDIWVSSHGGTIARGERIIITVWHALISSTFAYMISLDYIS